MDKEKIFMNGIFVREKTFDNGGSILNVDIINVNEFGEQLQKHAKSDGKITLEIKSRREKAENGLTHYVEVSQFVPKPKPKKEVNNSFETGDDVPF
mgnify:CR=1 FL=1